MSNGKEVAIKKGQAPTSFMALALEKNVTPEQIEKMMDLQFKWEASQARKAYFAAMAAFKENPPDIDKDKKVRIKHKEGPGFTEYKHATLANVTSKISAALSKHGLSVSWTTPQEGTQIKVTCRISHVLGHHEETSLSAGHDSSGSKNPIQALGSTISYLERYTVMALTGLASREMDDDAQATVEYISEKQLSTIVDMINAKGVDEAKFLGYMEAETLAKIEAKDFNKAMTALRAKVAK